MAAQPSNIRVTTKTNSTSSKRNLSSSSLSPKPEDKKSKIFITPNRYSVLTTLNDSNDNTQPNKTQTHTQSIPSKPPAVYIKGVSNFSSFTSNLMNIINTTEFICKTTPSHLIIHTHFYEHYSLLIKYLIENNMSFHSYQQYDKRPLRVVIRNLHPSTSTEDITTSLSELGHQVTHVHNIKRFSDKSPLPLFFVDLKKATNNMDLYKIEYLLHTKIVVEKPHPRKGPPQCHRCLSYGHTQNFCNHIPRCIRCGEEHRSDVCTLSPESPARCALCQGNHPANYKGCPVYKKLNNKKLNTNKPKTSLKAPPTVIPDAQAKSKARSYAEAAANNNPTINIVTSALSQFITNLNSVIGPLISLLTEVLQKRVTP